MRLSQMACNSKTASCDIQHFKVIWGFLKVADNLITVGHRAKQIDICDLGLLVEHVFGVVFKAILGSFGALHSKWPVIKITQEWLMIERKHTEIWDSGLDVGYIWGTFHLLVFKAIFGSSGARLKMALTPKGLGVKQNRLKFGTKQY